MKVERAGIETLKQQLDEALAGGEPQTGAPPPPPNLPPRPLAGNGGGMEPRIAKLESDMEHVKKAIDGLSGVPSDLATLKATLPHLATKADLAGVLDAASGRLRNHLYIVGVGLAALTLIMKYVLPA